MMASAVPDAQGVRDDRILPYVRVLSAAIIPFLLLAFVVLYGFPGNTARVFAWPIKATMTSMTLASAYLGGAYFFARVMVRRRGWHTVRTGLAAVCLFATMLGAATLVHWNVFSHGKPAFWLWAGLYLTTPFLVTAGWLANQRRAAKPSPSEILISRRAARTVGLVGGLALAQGILLFAAPALLAPLWPWPLTTLTARVIGAVFCLGCAGLVTLRDRRWSSLKLLLQVEMIMIVLILTAAIRALGELDPHRALTWLLLCGLLLVLVGSACLWWAMERPSRVVRVRTGPGRL